MSRLFVPMTKATGIGPLPQVLERRANARTLHRAFDDAGLPLDVLEFPDTRIPVAAMQTLFETSAKATGDRCFGLSVGADMTHRSFGLWMQYCAQAPDVRTGLRRAVTCCAFHQTGGYLVFHDVAPISIWHYVSPPSLNARPIQHADHLIGPMLRFMRSFLGPDWSPEWVDVNYPRDPLFRQMERQLALPVRFGAAGVGLAIRHSDLNRKSFPAPSARSTITFAEVKSNELEAEYQEPLASVFSAICLRLLDGQTNIEGAAQALGVGVQKLQRKLREEGVDYRFLLNQAKRLRAQSLLTDTALPVTEIALALGYSDHANFSRAFKHLVGIAPVHYRSLRATPLAEPVPGE